MTYPEFYTVQVVLPDGRNTDEKIFEFEKLFLGLVEKVLHVLLHEFQLLMISIHSVFDQRAEFLKNLGLGLGLGLLLGLGLC